MRVRDGGWGVDARDGGRGWKMELEDGARAG